MYARHLLLSAIAAVLALVAALLPWRFGGGELEVQAALAMVTAVASVVAVGCRNSGQRPLPMLGWLLVASVFWGMLQLVPIPEPLQPLLMPGHVAWQEEAPEAGKTAPQLDVRSIYPAATRRDVSNLILAVTAFFLAFVSLGDPLRAKMVCLTHVIVGATLSLLALVERIRPTGWLLWNATLSEGGQPLGPFVNRNNGGVFLNICLAAAIMFAGHLRPSSKPPTKTSFSVAQLWLAGRR